MPKKKKPLLREDLPDLDFWVGKPIATGRPSLKDFLKNKTKMVAPVSSWIAGEKEIVDYIYDEQELQTELLRSARGGEGNDALIEILGKKAFDHPKPPSLMKALVNQATGSDDLVLDFFAGSGTTAQAVLELNQADGEKQARTEPSKRNKTAYCCHGRPTSRGRHRAVLRLEINRMRQLRRVRVLPRVHDAAPDPRHRVRRSRRRAPARERRPPGGRRRGDYDGDGVAPVARRSGRGARPIPDGARAGHRRNDDRHRSTLRAGHRGGTVERRPEPPAGSLAPVDGGRSFEVGRSVVEVEGRPDSVSYDPATGRLSVTAGGVVVRVRPRAP